MPKKIHTIGYASGIAAREHSSEDGPSVIQRSPLNEFLTENKLILQWEDVITGDHSSNHVPTIAALCTQLAEKTKNIITTTGKPFLIMGGDHSSAIGTWSGAATALQARGTTGLIWIDAHMDSHTPETTESGNIHGMPLAALMGYGDSRLTQIISTHPKLQPESVVLIGVRSFEKGEAALLKRLNIRIFDMPEIHARGMTAVMQEAVEIVSKNTVGYGISIDIDSIDPTEAPGTGAKEPDGIAAQDLCTALQKIQPATDKRFIGAEIAEFDPHQDKNQKTEKIVFDLIKAIFG